MFITITATTALVSAAINVAALAAAGYAGYRYLGSRYAEMKEWINAHDTAHDETMQHEEEEKR